MREFYENNIDRKNEKEIAWKIGVQTGLQFYKNKPDIRIDFSFCDSCNNVKFFAEMKRRNHNFGFYSTLNISATKLNSALSWKKALNIPIYLFIEYNDGIKWIELLDHDGIIIWGRKDRNDNQDIEPSIKLNIDRFKDLIYFNYKKQKDIPRRIKRRKRIQS